jgi:hypothetical protein
MLLHQVHAIERAAGAWGGRLEAACLLTLRASQRTIAGFL